MYLFLSEGNNQLPQYGSLKLFNGAGSTGALHIFVKNQFHPICDTGFGHEELNVVCRQLGFESGLQIINNSLLVLLGYSIHTCVHQSIYSSIHTCIYSFIHPCISPSVHLFIHSYIHSFHLSLDTDCLITLNQLITIPSLVLVLRNTC